jgi:hypothetical protein
MVIVLLKAACLGAYLMALAGLAGLLGADLTQTSQNLALALLGIHALELLVMFKYVRLYRGSLLTSIVLTMLFGLLHWRPLAKEAAKKQIIDGHQQRFHHEEP